MNDPFELLESLLWQPSTGFSLLQEHVERLTKTAEHFSYPFDKAELTNLIESVEATTPLFVRILVDAAGTIRLESRPSTKISENPTLQLCIDTQPIDRSNEFIYYKTTRRSVYDEAKSRHPKCDDVVLWNDDEEITETTRANIVIKHQGRHSTPPVTCGLLAGTLRAKLLRSGLIKEEKVTIDQLRQAENIYVINSVRGWASAQLV